MNYLAHFALADGDHQLLVGGFLGDYVRGRLNGRHDAGIERGISLHRAIDAFTDKHDKVRQSARRLAAPFRRYAGLITDIAYDHLLARSWHHYYNEDLADFSLRTLTVLLENKAHLPAEALVTAQRMHHHNALAGYGHEIFLKRALTHLSGRLTRANPLCLAAEECNRLMPEFRDDFNAFYPALIAFTEDWKRRH